MVAFVAEDYTAIPEYEGHEETDKCDVRSKCYHKTEESFWLTDGLQSASNN